ncbi:MAG: ATP-binding cassette domain-containing protein, partial [Acidimicrobiales bacterium]
LRGMYSPVRQLAKLAGVVGRAQAASERVIEILSTAEEVPERPHARRVRRARGELSLEGVSFVYPDGTAVLNSLDLEVPVGTRQALVGATGSGKSTLLRLIPRFADPTNGIVRLDGVDVADLVVADLRRQVAFVPQEPYLFRASVWGNIVYGSPLDRREMAITAARSIGVDEVIESFPAGYDTLVAERGSSLSGGQRQCVAVARAMARDAPLLLFEAAWVLWRLLRLETQPCNQGGWSPCRLPSSCIRRNAATPTS